MTIFAQTGIETIPPGILKWMIVFLIGLIVVAGILVGIIANLRRKAVHISPQPLSFTKTPKRYNHDLTEQRFQDHDRRIVNLETQHSGLITKLDKDKNDIMEAAQEGRAKLHKRINNQSRMLYLIAGKLGVNVSRDGEEEE